MPVQISSIFEFDQCPPFIFFVPLTDEEQSFISLYEVSIKAKPMLLGVSSVETKHRKTSSVFDHCTDLGVVYTSTGRGRHTSVVETPAPKMPLHINFPISDRTNVPGLQTDYSDLERLKLECEESLLRSPIRLKSVGVFPFALTESGAAAPFGVQKKGQCHAICFRMVTPRLSGRCIGRLCVEFSAGRKWYYTRSPQFHWRKRGQSHINAVLFSPYQQFKCVTLSFCTRMYFI